MVHESIMKAAMAVPVGAVLLLQEMPQLDKWIQDNGVAVGLIIVFTFFVLFFYWPWFKEKDAAERLARQQDRQLERERYDQVFKLLQEMNAAEERKLAGVLETCRNPLVEIKTMLEGIAQRVKGGQP
jgi:signal transduction histidine kinase